jgi:tetratricopeptide (TPR) repeat protein
MRKFPLVLGLVFCFAALAPANAQVTRLQAREAEWKSYSLPTVNFARYTDPEKKIVFRAPADWKQEGSELVFNGPHTATIRAVIQKLPDGYPLQDYFGAILQVVKDTPGAAETTLTRKTQLQDLEAREITFESVDPEGELYRSTSWITINGPVAVVFNFQSPVANAAELEPTFKAVVQSILFTRPDYSRFEDLRNSSIKSHAPGPINEIEQIVASLNDVNPERESAVARLSALFSSAPDTTIDLLLDRRPLIRAAVAQALARSNNTTLTPFLWELIDAREPFIAEAAARSLANSPNLVTEMLKHSFWGMNTEPIARIWPFMSKEKQNELLQTIFKQTAIKNSPPPAAKVFAPAKGRPKNNVSVAVGELLPAKPGQTELETLTDPSRDPNVQIGALTLLSSIPPEEFALPLEKLIAAHYDPLVAIGLQVANDRGEMLPVNLLLPLVSSADEQVSKLAAESLGQSAVVADIPRIEALISKDGSKKTVDEELRRSVKKIRFRDGLRTASAAEKHELILKTQSDAALANFAWRHDCEGWTAGCSPATPLKNGLTIKPFGENLFPKNVRHYTAIPKPAEAVQKFYETLHELQMESPRAQSHLVLMLGNMRQMIGEELSAPTDADTLFRYTGIDPDSPIVLGAWTAPNAKNSTTVAERKAIVLRVKDRARFERVVERFQRGAGGFTDLTHYLAIGTRAAAALPAFLPLIAQALLSHDDAKPKSGPLLQYSLVGNTEWNGLRIKNIEHTWINSDWKISGSNTYLLYVGDTAILASDIATLRELALNASNGGEGQLIADNPEFRRALERSGDVVYFSDIKAVFEEASDTDKNSPARVSESGALKFTGSAWENSHQISFDESDWAKALLPFQPKELSAPRELLPASTIAYYLMKIDFAAASTSSAKNLVPNEHLEAFAKVWALDLKQDVMPELGPECGAVMLELPEMESLDAGTWAFFCKLKSNKLSEALTTGKLFRGIGPTADVAQLKIGEDSYFVAARRGFLVVSNAAKGLAVLDGKSNLTATRDYSRAVEKVPDGIVAFGGYNLEAAIAAASRKTKENELNEQIASVIFSIASAFHSQHFFATANPGSVQAHSSVSMDREGRYRVADFSYLPRAENIIFATVEPRGLPITDQNRLSDLVLRVKAKAPGPIDDIKDDIVNTHQTVEQKSATELILKIAARRSEPEQSIQLPVNDPALAQYLKATAEFAADNKEVQDRAREITGADRDAWSVARKLADWTHKNLEWKYVAHADASATLATREADCTEFSELFIGMARSLGLPARMVSGLAYSGSSFGGHAWVEVWIGKWIELDPTWGTNFVDATHIRNTSNALLTSAGLNLIELEVVEAKRTAAEFQKSPRALAEHLVKTIPQSDRPEIAAAMDIEILTDQFMGAGSWARLSETERDQMWSAYRRVLLAIMLRYGKSESTINSMHLFHVEEKGDVAEAICVSEPNANLLKLKFVRRDGVWSLVEVLDTDDALYVASETLRPTLNIIEKTRAGEKIAPSGLSEYMRALFLIQGKEEKALELLNGLLKSKPKDQGVRFLKAQALLKLDKSDEAKSLLTELSNENYAPAVFRLASQYSHSDTEAENKLAVNLYERYIVLEPHDPRAVSRLASAYEGVEDYAKAEVMYRKAIEMESFDTTNYSNLIEFLIMQDRIGEVRPLLVAGEKYAQKDEDLFGDVIELLTDWDETEHAEKFAASEPSRMKTSALANYSLGLAYIDAKRYVEAMRLLSRAAEINKTWPAPHTAIALLHRRQSRWLLALKAADHAVALDGQFAEGHYYRACALARLGRTSEAMTALKKSLELAPYWAASMAEEKDLERLSSLPEFKKLIPPPKP